MNTYEWKSMFYGFGEICSIDTAPSVPVPSIAALVSSEIHQLRDMVANFESLLKRDGLKDKVADWQIKTEKWRGCANSQQLQKESGKERESLGKQDSSEGLSDSMAFYRVCP